MLDRTLYKFGAVLFACTLLACDEPAEPDQDLVDDLQNDAEFRVQWDAMLSHVGFATDGSLAARATGSVQEPIRDNNGVALFSGNGDPLRTTCGITFISPHYAVTAAHCVDGAGDPATKIVTVEQYDISGVDIWSLAFSTLVTGTFPNIDRTYPIENDPNYDVESYECRLTARCGGDSYNCGFSADIALVRCSGRTSTDWLPIAASDPGVGPVEMYWAHEMLNIPSDAPVGDPQSSNRYAYYTLLDTQATNYHYIGGDSNALLPLKSINWPAAQGGGPHERLGFGTATDLFGCHGTSGSGVLQRNNASKLELLGPVSTGGIWANGRLCANPNTYQPGDVGLRYLSNAKTRQLQSAFFWPILLDRWLPPAPPNGPLAPVQQPSPAQAGS